MIFIDSNIPMYLVGADHPNKHRARVLVEQLVLSHSDFATDAEVFQEILHRYRALQRMELVEPAWSFLSTLCSRTLSIEEVDVRSAAVVLQSTPQLSARDAIHVAVMQRWGVREILSFDAGFDALPGLTRHS